MTRLGGTSSQRSNKLHDLDEGLVAQAQRLGRHRNKKEAITEALREYVHLREQKAVLRVYEDLEEEGGFDR